jgi:AAA15 family ATPase/GTPase
MIEHIFIKNYKAFKKENIPLDKNTLLIGTNNTGKTTVLEALDLFFNDKLNHTYILDKTQDIVVEIHMNEERYRKTYSPPSYHINYDKCIGDMYSINHLQYLYIPQNINVPVLLNRILSIDLTEKPKSLELSKIVKVSDYIDGVLGNSNYPLFKVTKNIEMKVPGNLHFTKKELTRIVSNITYQHLIVGIDHVEDNFDIHEITSYLKYTYQTIFTTKKKKVASDYKYYVSYLYKGDQVQDFDTIKKRVEEVGNTYLLVEGKYDVNWFETALKLLHKEDNYTVIPCGGCGNIGYVKDQLEKEGFKTLVITDGDTKQKGSLQREIIELYADIKYINDRFNTNLTHMPKDKNRFFKHFHVKNDVVKNVLSRWAKKNLTTESIFVKEIETLLM